MVPDTDFSDDDIEKRLKLFYGEDYKMPAGKMPMLRLKLSNLSEFMRDIKVNFARYYNRRHNRRGDRFKNVFVDRGETLVNCLAYIDLNPLRAGMVQQPEKYRWNSIGYHLQTGNKDHFLSTDFGFKEFNVRSEKERIRRYCSRYFTDSGIIGSKEFVSTHYQRFKHLFGTKNKKIPKPVKGLSGMYSLKRLSEIL